MIGLFPAFSPFRLGDREFVESVTRGRIPISDFNFTRLYSWDTTDSVSLAMLHGNVVFRLVDYTTSRPFFSFVGERNVEDTATQILEYAVRERLDAALRLVPESSALGLGRSVFDVEPDDDNADYILSIERLKAYQGNRLGGKRNFVNRFNRLYQSSTLAVDLGDIGMLDRRVPAVSPWQSKWQGASARGIWITRMTP